MTQLSCRLLGAALLSVCSWTAEGATIVNWNLANVEQVPVLGEPTTGVSVVYDRDVTNGTAGAISRGSVLWLASPQPGMTILNNDLDLNPGIDETDCIIVLGANCEGPFQSDKRVKMRATDHGAIDLVFNTRQDDETNSYRLFHRIINVTDAPIRSYTIELGSGVGDSFVLSSAGDGLGFGPDAELGPNNEPAFTQFSFGLFGDAPEPQLRSGWLLRQRPCWL